VGYFLKIRYSESNLPIHGRYSVIYLFIFIQKGLGLGRLLSCFKGMAITTPSNSTIN
jgi:hypothetical protein